MSMISMARIKPRTDGLFEFNTEGEPAFVVPVLSFVVEIIGLDLDCLPVEGEVYDTVDYVAWLPDEPGKWWLRLGNETPVLGALDLRIAADMGYPIRLWPTPQAWVQSGGVGVCILTWGAQLDYLFEGVGRIDCCHQKLQQRFLADLRRWEPPVVVKHEAHHAV